MAPNSPSGGTVNPPTPWIGSAIRQATSPAVAVTMTSRRSSTAAAMSVGRIEVAGTGCGSGGRRAT